MKPSEAKHIKINDKPPSVMTANFLCSVAEDMSLNEREARLLAAKFEATPCYAEYSALCAVRDAARDFHFIAHVNNPDTAWNEANNNLNRALFNLANIRS